MKPQVEGDVVMDTRESAYTTEGKQISPLISFSFFFWTWNERAPSGVTSKAPQCCCENNCHNLHYYDEAGKSVKRDTRS